MNIQKEQLFLISLICLLVRLIRCQEETIDFIYNPTPYKTFDVSSQNGSSHNIQVASSANVEAVAVGEAGIMIIDSQFNSYIFKSPDNSYIQCIQITSDARYVFSAMKNKIGVFELVNFRSLNQISSISELDFTVNDMQFYQNEDVLFIIGLPGLIQWYDIRNKFNIQLIGQYKQDSLYVKGLFSPDLKFLYIAADSDGLFVFLIQNNQDASPNSQLQINLKRILKKPPLSNFVQLAVTNQNEYLFAIDTLNGVFLLHKLSDMLISGSDIENKNLNIIQMQPLKLDQKFGYFASLSISSNNLFLYLGVRSQGILIYNIRNPKQPKFYQQLQLIGQSVSLCLSPKLNKNSDDIFDNKYIYYSNSLSLIIFQKQQPVLQKQIPNLFNFQQSKSFQIGTSVSKLRCKISPNGKYFYGTFNSDSLIIYQLDISQQTSQASKMTLKFQFSESNQSIESVSSLRKFKVDESIPNGFYINDIQFSKNGKYLYFPSKQINQGVIAYKFEIQISEKDEYTFKLVKGLQQLQNSKVDYSKSIDISDDEKNAIFSYSTGILLVDLDEFQVLSQLIIDGLVSQTSGAVFSHDKKYALSVARNVGLYIFDISVLKTPKLVNQWRTNGGETLVRSSTDNVIYFIDGFNGIILLDSTKLPEIVILSKFISNGWSNFITLSFNESYGIISTMDTGMLTLIDLNDKKNPKLVMKISIKGQDSITTCLDHTKLKFGFSTNSQGVTYFSMQSSVSINIDCYIKSLNNKIMSLNESFEIGNSYIVNFVPLYRKQNQIITDLFYYKNLEFQSLPTWIQIVRDNQIDSNLFTKLQIDLSKESLDSPSNEMNFLIIVIKTCFQLSESSFIFDTEDLTTTTNESLTIYNYLISNNYINTVNCVSDYYKPTVKEIIYLDDAFKGQNIDQTRLSIVQAYVSETLKKSTAFNQFIFNVKNSLKFDQKNKNQMFSSTQNYIYIKMSFSSTSPFIFVFKPYTNLLIDLNDKKTILKMEGKIEDINLAFSQKILYFDQSKKQEENNRILDIADQTIEIEIQDKSNYNLKQKFIIPHEVQFLQEKQQIILVKSLQEQVNMQYDGNSLYIDVPFLIVFDDQSFQDPDQIPLTYQFEQKSKGDYKIISTNSFIKYDNIGLRLVGTPPESSLLYKPYLRLKVTNGYTTLYEEFTFKVSLMTFNYVQNKALQILGPIAFVFGIYRKRQQFMNLYFKNNTMYSTEIIHTNQLYRKKIVVLGDDYKLAFKFFKRFLKEKRKRTKLLKQSKNQINTKTLDINTQINHNNNNETPRDKNLIINSLNNSQLIFQQQNNKKDLLPFVQSTIRSEENLIQSKVETNQMEFKETNNKISQDNDTNLQFSKLTQKLAKQNTLQKTQNELYKQDIKFLHKKTSSKESQKYFSYNQIQGLEKDKKKGNDKLVEINEENKKDYFFIKYLVMQEDGNIDLEKMFNLMLEYQIQLNYKEQIINIQKYQGDMHNQNSRFYNCFKAVVIRYLVGNNEKTKYFYNFLKKYSLETNKYTQNDWYKLYVQSLPTSEMDQDGAPIPFSKTFLKEDSLMDIYKILEFTPNNQEKENFNYLTISQFQINPYLIRDILFADALGLELVTSKHILKCRGESLHLQNHSILSIEAFKLHDKGMFLGIKRAFNLNYKSLPISKYVSLPGWLQYDYKNGVIVLEGVPTKLDVNHILIIIYNRIHFASFQYHLIIKEGIVQEHPYQVEQNENNRLLQSFEMKYENKLLNSSLSPSKRKSLYNIQHQQNFNKQNSPINARDSKFKSHLQLKQKISSDSIYLQDENTQYEKEYERNIIQDEIYEEGMNSAKPFVESQIGSTPPLFPQIPKFQGDKLKFA